MLTSEMSSENIKNIDIELTGLLLIGSKVANIISEDNITIRCSNSSEYDLIMEIGRDKNLHIDSPFNNINPGTYYFNTTNLPEYLRSPEIIDVITKKCCIKSEETKSGWDLKPEYKQRPLLINDDNPFGSKSEHLELTEELMEIYYKVLNEKQLGHKYALIGQTDRFESQEQRIENFINSGRADRIYSEGANGLGVQHTVGLILKDNKKVIKTAHVMQQSFPLDKESKKIPRNKRWVRVIVD